MKRKRSGQTMVELLAATAIITIALVPALRLTRDGMMRAEELENAELRLALCTSKLEEEMARTAAAWDMSIRSGDFSGIGRSELRFMVTKSDAAVDGGIPGSLATIDAIVWHDEDQGGDLDSNENRIRLTTKLARLISYEYESSIH